MRTLVVLGDALLDVDVEGSASRLSPDAPVPVVDSPVEAHRPGGAALAACLAAERAGDDVEVVLVTALPDDTDADVLAGLVADAGVRLVRVRRDGSSIVKRRVRAGGQTVVRLDTGDDGEVVDAAAAVEALAGAAGVLVSDYGRGLTAHPGVREALTAAAARVPVVWDPHPRGAAPVPGVRLATPNQAEAGAGPGLAALADRLRTLREDWRAHAVVVTLGESGALLGQGDSPPAVVPAPAVHATDPCGAGDCFAATAALALLGGALTSEAVQEAVAGAATYVAAGGAATWRPSAPSAPPTDASAEDLVARVRAAGGTVVATGGCFDLLHAGHVATLRAARSLGDCLVVCLNSDSSVRGLKGPSRPLQGQDDRATVLTALADVDAVVVFDEATPEEALRRLRPDVWVKGGDYAGVDLPEAPLLAEWGGQAVVVPYLQGRSTTGLVAAATA